MTILTQTAGVVGQRWGFSQREIRALVNTKEGEEGTLGNKNSPFSPLLSYEDVSS